MDKIALVTGASRGIGSEIAKTLAREEYIVIVNYKNNIEKAQQVVDEISREGGHAKCFQADVSKEEDVISMFKYIKSTYKRIDVLINNAGITSDSFLMSMSLDVWNKVLHGDLTSTFLCSREAVKMMHYYKIAGRIVNISSVSGLVGLEGQVNYSAAKGGVIALTKAVAKEVAKDNILVNCVAPGFIESDMTKGVNQKIIEQIMDHISIKRYGTSKEVAELVRFLCSEHTGYITGKVFTIDGGMVY